MNTKLPNYRIYDGTGGGVTEDIYADSPEAAIEAGRKWIENGDWSSDHDEDAQRTYRTIVLDCCVREIVYIPDLSSIESLPGVYEVRVVDGRIVADVDPDALAGIREALSPITLTVVDGSTGEDGVATCDVGLVGPIPQMIDEDATAGGQSWDCSGTYSDTLPECKAQRGQLNLEAGEEGHVWRSVTEMGQQFGCRSHGGTSMSHYEVCRLCGQYKTTTTAGVQRNHDEPSETITITDRGEASEQWLKEQHAEDDFLPAWLSEMLGCSPSLRMTEEQAREWVAAHDDNDVLDADELEHAFAATFGRRAANEDRSQGLWSLLNA